MKLFRATIIFASILLSITACEPEETEIFVTGVTVNHPTSTLEIGGTLQLTATVAPQDATNKNVTWSSSANGVATVSEAGLVTSVSDGIAIIKVTSEDGNFQASCTVTVEPDVIHVTGFELDITSDTLDINCTLQLTATITPENATDKSIAWSTSNGTVATVNNSGLVTGIGGGSATITATTNDGSFTATCEILVNGKGSFSTLMDKGFLVTPGAGVGVDMAIDDSGLPYLALNRYNDVLNADTKASCEVWKYSSGTNWNQFGNRVAITDDEAYAPGIVIDQTGNVYVSHKYFEDDSDNRYNANVVAYSTGGAWTYLGTGSVSLIKNGSTPLNGGSELALKEDGTLLAANNYYGYGYVHYWDGSWKSYNGYKTNSSSFWAGGIDIECFGNKPLVSVRTSSGDGKTGVLYGNETNGINGQWEWLGGSYANSVSQNCSFKDEVVNDASLAVNSKGDVFTAYKAYFDGSYHIVVKTIETNATSWSQIYSSGDSNAEQVDVVVANDYVYLLVAEYDDGISIYRLTQCGEWVFEGRTTKPDIYYNFDAVAGKNGEIFIGYECTQNSDGQVGVFKYTPYSNE